MDEEFYSEHKTVDEFADGELVYYKAWRMNKDSPEFGAKFYGRVRKASPRHREGSEHVWCNWCLEPGVMDNINDALERANHMPANRCFKESGYIIEYELEQKLDEGEDLL